jgi:transposase
MKAYSLDLRQRVLEAALSDKHTIAEVAALFGVGTTFVNKMLSLHRQGQDLAPRPHGGGQKARLSATHHKMLRSEVRRHNDATIAELRAHLADEAGVEVSIPTLGRVLQQLGLGRKKSV